MTEPQCQGSWRPRPLDKRCLTVEFSGRHCCTLDRLHRGTCNCSCGADRFDLRKVKV